MRANMMDEATITPTARRGESPSVRQLRRGKRQGGGRARSEPSEKAGQSNSLPGAENFDESITDQIDPGDEDDHEPDFAGIENVERTECAVGEDRKNDDRDDAEFKRRDDVARVDPLSETLKGAFESQKKRGDNGEGSGERPQLPPGHCAKDKCKQCGDLGGQAGGGLGSSRNNISGENKSRHDSECRHEGPGGEKLIKKGGGATEHGDKRERADSGECPPFFAFAFEANQEPQGKSKGEALKENGEFGNIRHLRGLRLAR